MRKPNEYEALKTPGHEPVESEVKPQHFQPERDTVALPITEYLSSGDKIAAERAAKMEELKTLRADNKINSAEFYERLNNHEAEQHRKLEAGYYDDATAARPSGDNTQKRDNRREERGDRDTARSESNAQKEQPAEREGAGQSEVSEAKAARKAKFQEQFDKFDKEAAGQQQTRPHGRGGRD